MSTSFPKSEPSTPKDIGVANAYENILRFLQAQRESAGANAGTRVFSTNRLVDVAGEISSVTLADALARLVKDGLLDQFLRVESRPGSGLQDFPSLQEVPDEVYDWRDSHETLRVTPSNLRVYYRLHEAS